MSNGYCGYGRRVCPHMLYTDGVTFVDDTLTLNIELPEGVASLPNRSRWCVVVKDTIPDTVTRNAPVVITLGGGTVQYPLVNRCGVQVTERAIDTRTRYAVEVVTSAAGGSFRLLGRTCPDHVSVLAAIDGTEGGGDNA